MIDLWIALPAGLVSAGAGWFGKVTLQALKNGPERRKVQADTDIRLEEHRDQLTFDLLNAARSEISGLRQEVADLRPLQSRLAHLDVRLAHFDEALELIERLMAGGSAEEQAATKRQARAFVTRMRRLADANGTLANEEQIARSAASVPADMRDSLNKLP